MGTRRFVSQRNWGPNHIARPSNPPGFIRRGIQHKVRLPRKIFSSLQELNTALLVASYGCRTSRPQKLRLAQYACGRLAPDRRIVSIFIDQRKFSWKTSDIRTFVHHDSSGSSSRSGSGSSRSGSGSSRSGR